MLVAGTGPDTAPATSHAPPSVIKIDETVRDLRAAVGKIIFAQQQLGLGRGKGRISRLNADGSFPGRNRLYSARDLLRAWKTGGT
jgi:hypothetical protein